MEISDAQWNRIRSLFAPASHVAASIKRNVPYCSIATVDEDGAPRVTPISSLILGENRQGFYFEEFSTKMSANLRRDQRVCVLIVNNAIPFWVKSILLGRFDGPPAIRLWGTVGERRKAQPHEIEAYRSPIRPLKIFKGYDSLWGVMKHGREIYFNRFENVECGPMKQGEPL